MTAAATELQPSQALTESPSPNNLFLIEGGVHPDVTSLFLRANESMQEQLLDCVTITKEAVGQYEAQTGRIVSPRVSRAVINDRTFRRMAKLCPDLIDDLICIHFRDQLTGHSSVELERIEAELSGIMAGSIRLTDSEKQQLSNLSDGSIETYLGSLGMKAHELAFPLLDVGTGKHAYFAQGVLREFPTERMVSTSMHLLHPNSVMSRALAGQADRGELVACNGIDMPFADETFNMVISLNADPYYVPRSDLEVSLREKHRVLRVGGTALLCPAVCDYSKYDITDEDIEPLRAEMDVSIQPIPASGRRYYDTNTHQLLVIRK